ncbi:MAG: hypothetical protein ACLFP4_02355 [Spirochaetales bacterium]
MADSYRGRTSTQLSRVVTLVLAIFVSTPLAAQSDGNEPAFAPFVSRFRLAIADPEVLITWEPAPGPVTGYAIYRSTEEISTASFGEADLVDMVGPEAESYVDIPPEPGSYHYAVVVLTASGAPIRVIIPGRNASFRPVDIAEVATDLQRSADVEQLAAQVEDPRTIALSLRTDKPGRTIALYRSTRPIISFESLSDATLFREITSQTREVLDFPVPGVEYYYAAVDTARILSGEVAFEAGVNTTGQAISLPLDEAPRATTATAEEAEDEPGEEIAGLSGAAAPSGVRSMPLPFLQLQNRLSSETALEDPRLGLSERREVSATTLAGVERLLENATAPLVPQPGPAILPEDTAPEPTGAEYTLRTILDGPFVRLAWEEALDQLERFFDLPLNPELQARAHYYRAQLYHFLGQRQTAILEFLLARDRYYVASERWIAHILASQPATSARP